MNTDRETLQLVNLSGLPDGVHTAIAAGSRTDALMLFRAGNVVTGAGSNGAINLWRDSDGLAHCEFSRWRQTISSFTTKSTLAVGTWLAEWWPAMGKVDR